MAGRLQPMRNFIKFLRAFYFIPDIYWAKKIPFRTNPREFSLDRVSKELVVKRLGVHLEKGKQDFLIEALDWLLGLQSRFGITLRIEPTGDVILEIGGVKFLVEDIWDIGTIKEIFADHVYNFVIGEPLVVLDIGMNIGVASLFFAANPNVQTVYGYEPFQQTYRHAERNLSLNPALIKKVVPHHYGIDNTNRTLSADFDTSSKPDNSTHHFPVKSDYKTAAQTIIQEIVEVKNIVEEVDKVRALYPDVELIGKIDCEGAEYNIIEALNSADRLKEFSLLMIEWHVLGPDRLIDSLQRSGYKVLSFGSFRRNDVGLIYAIRC